MNRFDLQPKREATLPPLNDAQQQYARGHLVLARRLAWKQFQSCARTMPLDELNGEAMYALVYAAGMFDEERGVPFGAFATMAITHRLIQAVNVWRRGGRLSHIRFTDLSASTASDFDTPCPRTRESMECASLHEQLDRVRRSLPPRWFTVLQLYYGDGHTLEEVGHRLGVTRERVRQLITKAVGRARKKVAA